jgi:putative SOS response-associated peptidase YedK
MGLSPSSASAALAALATLRAAAHALPMCNRYRMSEKEREVAAHFGVLVPPDLSWPQPELFPKREGIVVRRNEAGALILDRMVWGFPPPPRSRTPVTNVRNLASPFWRSALNRPARRCLVPVTEFCEWEGEAGAKKERWFSVAASPLFAFAGVWRPLEEGRRAYAFLTCEPNPLVAPVHATAMPVMLQPEDYDRWLSAEIADACSLAQPFPSQLMRLS